MTDPTRPESGAFLDEDAVEALLAGDGPADPLTAVLDDLREVGRGPGPTASPELAALLGATAADEVARRRRTGRIVVGVVLAGTATLTLSGVAAAHDALPGPAQRAVTAVVDDLTPFSIDRRDDAPRPAPARPPAAPATTSAPAGPSPSPAPSPRSSARPSPAGPAAATPQENAGGPRGTGHDGGDRTSGTAESGRDDGARSGRPSGGTGSPSAAPSRSDGDRSGDGGGSDGGGSDGGGSDGGGSGG